MIPVNIQNTFYKKGNDSLPAISVSASRNQDRITHISLVNIDPETKHEVRIICQGSVLKLDSGRILQSAKIQDHNSFDDPDKIKPQSFKQVTIKGNEILVEMPAASVVVLTLHE
jgi:alpha-N-arabinofuranosidase